MDMNNNINKPSFDTYIEELYKINAEDKKRAERIAKRGLEELGYKSDTKSHSSTGSSKTFLGIDTKQACLIFVCILIALCGCLVQDATLILMYIFGLVFFFAGVFVSLTFPLFGLIFLATHGGTGLFIMISSLVSSNIENLFQITKNPAFSDGGIPADLKQYLIATGCVFIVAIIYTILHNLSPRLKEDKKHMIIILFIFFIGILLVGLAPRIFPYLIFSD